ncbi:hydroxyacylglutathione hydrolase [Massilia sp. TS11]|uniref:hydroxyacylglutathione hydrolase n=1 Tax=Massilia sp. TS11 TaxID=2908003 RepID=UPI001EDAF86C|nr:hydroxyacylglutathione hydrolase [Massilia sp. TS11]MCG2584641.1 hydroxyacylglutathione hydrolase [Massilia sp. TS11]
MNSDSRSTLAVLRVPAFRDNYLWLVHDGQAALVVDPGDAAPIKQALADHGLRLTAILLTHHHADHTGGVDALRARWQAPVFGPRHDGIAAVERAVGEGDLLRLDSPACSLRVLDVPGHTRGHIAYYAADAGFLFCGDTLFAGGCGRLFEGSPAQMQASLHKLAALPPDTQVFCAHEYTASNLAFAVMVEPDNAALTARQTAVAAARAAGQATVPSTIGLERATNPFLRVGQPTIRHSLIAAGRLSDDADTVAAFAALRQWKNEA